MIEHFHRRNLPHLYFTNGIYFITARLKNSIPINILQKIKIESRTKLGVKEKRLFQKYDNLLDTVNFGQKYLSIPECAEIVKTTIHYLDGKDYTLICYCIMPNHFHIVFELLPNNKGISKIMQSIKRISARECNKYLNRTGIFWQDESYDHWIRDEKELYFVIRYVLLNPVKAGFVKNWDDWKYSYCNPDYLIL